MAQGNVGLTLCWYARNRLPELAELQAGISVTSGGGAYQNLRG